MGAAAYNRGSAVIARQFDAEAPAALMVLMRDLTEVSAASDGTVVFAPTVVRLDERGGCWVMNRQDKGWGEFGYPYASVWAAAKAWRLAFVGYDRDEHSAFFRVEPLPAREVA